MTPDDTLYGRIKNGVLTISGNSASIRVDGGSLIVSDGPVRVSPKRDGVAPGIEERMVTHRFRRADCPVKRIVVTRPDGFITFAAIKWLHGIGASLIQLDWDGTVLLTACPAGNDQPGLRRAQALASGSEIGFGITREILRAKLKGQAAVARVLSDEKTAELILKLTMEVDNAPDMPRLLAIESMAAAAYWPVWQPLPLRFARREQTPEHWRPFGNRHSPLSGRPFKAATPGNAILNYLYAVCVGEMTIALTGAGLDPGLGIFHADRDRRPSLAYDAIEALRPYVDAWLVAWLATARFAKRDFYEEADGAIRLTRPLTSHLAMTAAIWRPAAQAVAGWLARALAGSIGSEGRLPTPLPALPAQKRTWQGLEPPVPKSCAECGKALAPKQRKFCSEVCAISFHLASTTTETALPSGVAGAMARNDLPGTQSTRDKRRLNLALRRAWNVAHGNDGDLCERRDRNAWTKASGPAADRLRDWFRSTIAPLIATCPPGEICRVTGLSKRYAIMMRKGYTPHPRHYPALATLVGVEQLRPDGA